MKLRMMIAAGLVGLGCGAQAEDGFYYGIGAGMMNAQSDAVIFGGVSEDRFAIVGGTVGYRFEQEKIFYGAEIDADVSTGSSMIGTGGTDCDDFADGPYYCTHSSTVRLRGIVGTDVGGGYEAFGSLGVAMARGTSAVSPFDQEENMNRGVTFGMGVQRALGSGMLRLELTRDRLETSVTDPYLNNPTFESTSIKATFLF